MSDRPRQLRWGSSTLPLPTGSERWQWLTRPEPPAPTDVSQALAGVLREPQGGVPLVRHLEGRRRVGLVVPDGTRPLPVELLEALLDELRGHEVIVRVANGTHRRTTPDEHRRLLGRHAGQVPIGDRSADDEAAHARLPDTSWAIDAEAARCDALVLLGPTSFHYLAGFGGGGKLIAPGLSDRRTANFVHEACLADGGGRHPLSRAGQLEDNPLRARLEQVCALAPPQLYVIPVLDSAYRTVALFAGERLQAFEASSRWLLAHYGVACQRASTVIACAGGAPYDQDFVQAHKAWEMATRVAKPDGTIVWVAQCPEGLPDRHRAFLARHRTAAAMEQSLRAQFDIAAHTVWAARLKAERQRVVAVTGMDPALVEALGMEPAASLEEALGRVPLDDVAVLPHGARFLPLAD